MSGYPIKGAAHALHTGWLLGWFMRKGIQATPVKDENGDYTAKLRLAISDPEGRVVHTYIAVLPEAEQRHRPGPED